MSAAGRAVGIENIGVFRLELPILEETNDLTGAGSLRHFSGYFFAYSS
jgi:hypothetical protein